MASVQMNMDIEIFNVKASVEATSLYILLCALMDQGVEPTLREAAIKWNGDSQTLIAAAEELIRRCIIRGPLPVPMDIHLHPNTRDRWC